MDALSQGWQTPVTQDYLKIIWAAQESGHQGVSVNELAAKAGVVASTASENVKRLKDQGLVSHQPYQKVHLTREGWAVAVGMIRRHRILETFLHENLDFEWDEVHEEAEILEHAVSDRLLDRLDRALGYPTRDPHGDPIPRPDGSVTAVESTALSALPVGGVGVVTRISDVDAQVLRDLEALGIALDDAIRVQGCAADGTMGVQVCHGDVEAVAATLTAAQTRAIRVVVQS